MIVGTLYVSISLIIGKKYIHSQWLIVSLDLHFQNAILNEIQHYQHVTENLHISYLLIRAGLLTVCQCISALCQADPFSFLKTQIQSSTCHGCKDI